VIPYNEWLHSKAVPFDSDALSWALALDIEEVSAWLIDRHCPKNNAVFSFLVLVELHITGCKRDRQINAIRLKTKVERLLASGYMFDFDTLESVFKIFYVG